MFWIPQPFGIFIKQCFRCTSEGFHSLQSMKMKRLAHYYSVDNQQLSYPNPSASHAVVPKPNQSASLCCSINQTLVYLSVTVLICSWKGRYSEDVIIWSMEEALVSPWDNSQPLCKRASLFYCTATMSRNTKLHKGFQWRVRGYLGLSKRLQESWSNSFHSPQSFWYPL